jgi:hypothetical protein
LATLFSPYFLEIKQTNPIIKKAAASQIIALAVFLQTFLFSKVFVAS